MSLTVALLMPGQFYATHLVFLGEEESPILVGVLVTLLLTRLHFF